MRSDLRRLRAALTGALLATTLLAVPIAAQDATDSPPPASCDVLTVDEVSAAFQETVTLSSGAGMECQFDADFTAGRFLYVITSYQTDSTLDDWIGLLCGFLPSPSPGTSSPAPCSIDLTVGGVPAAYVPEGFGTNLYVTQGSDLFSLTLVGDPVEGVDKQAALTALAELALPRVAAAPHPTQEPQEPTPSFHGDTDLEAMFPTEIGGIAVEVQSLSGEDVVAQTSDVPQEFLDALAAQGKTLADVSIGLGSAFDASDGSYASITAVRIAGVDIAAIADDLVPVLNGTEAPASQTPGEVAGKPVTIVKPAADSEDSELQYVYPRGDVLWIVSAVEPDLTEVFQKLP